MTCNGKGAPVQGCRCSFCLILRPPIVQAPAPERINVPTGDFLGDKR